MLGPIPKLQQGTRLKYNVVVLTPPPPRVGPMSHLSDATISLRKFKCTDAGDSKTEGSIRLRLNLILHINSNFTLIRSCIAQNNSNDADLHIR